MSENGTISATGLPRLRRMSVSPCSTSVIKSDAFFRKSVNAMLFICHLIMCTLNCTVWAALCQGSIRVPEERYSRPKGHLSIRLFSFQSISVARPPGRAKPRARPLPCPRLYGARLVILGYRDTGDVAYLLTNSPFAACYRSISFDSVNSHAEHLYSRSFAPTSPNIG